MCHHQLCSAGYEGLAQEHKGAAQGNVKVVARVLLTFPHFYSHFELLNFLFLEQDRRPREVQSTAGGCDCLNKAFSLTVIAYPNQILCNT